MRAGVLFRTWLSGLFGFIAVVAAFCVALAIAITGPPRWAELSSMGANIGAFAHRAGAFVQRLVEARQADQHAQEAHLATPPASTGSPPPPRTPARSEEPPPSQPSASQDAPNDNLDGGPDDATLPQAVAPPPRAFASRAPARGDTVRLLPPIAPATEEQPSLARQLASAIANASPFKAGRDDDTTEPTTGITPEQDDAKPAEPNAAPDSWSPGSHDRFPADDRDVARWRQQ